ncbi:glycosyltransferase family 4 protein [Salinarimonas ramus]|uniref:GDP-mannose-dependent alpha-mannosyltransferase n=1 Tax=Salinarimonas ramus TaxID=690164 RepID=A0A917V2I3_9HYPH|nr:glycosyltransferase family 1 protein [Salinarimonas ramus]GGK22795.1 GDP-mannose-dependent alpha-mannosyltransferase [Salinarimonas ramus]
MRLLVATDAWRPQINGVVRSIEQMIAHASAFDAEIVLLTPLDFRSLPMPTYPEIRLALARPRAVARKIRELAPTHIHIATEGPIGIATRKICLANDFAYTTSYHTRFPEYVSARAPVPERWVYRAIRRFHNTGRGIMVATDSLEAELVKRGFNNVLRWGRGVDTTLFRPRDTRVLDAPGPIFLYVGRVAVEKNLEAFLKLDLPGTKVIVGDGPARADLERRFPQARFLGARTGEALAEVYASADVFVFPSLTDTFGIVLLEALASGLPIAAYPVTGPLDVVGDSGCGVLSRDLREAALAALEIPRARCRAYGETFTWHESARQFFGNVRSAAGDDPVVDLDRL